MKFTKKNMLEFIHQSNLIEEVKDPKEIAQSYKAWEFLQDQPKLNLAVILETHRLIMQKLRPDIAGDFRKCDVWVGHRKCPPSTVVVPMLSTWLKMYDKPVIDAEEVKLAHIRFEFIHPFVDGNGRTGRLLFAWHRLKSNLPLEIIKYSDRWNYYQWFMQDMIRNYFVDKDGNTKEI